MTRTLLFTREKPISPMLQKQITSCGYQWQQVPLISLRLKEDLRELPLAISDYDWIFFTSAAAVRFFYQKYQRIPETCSLAVIGTKTFEGLKERDQARASYPSIFTSEDFIEEWLEKQPLSQKILIPQSELSRKIIQTTLREAGHFVDDFVLYHNDFLEEQQRGLKSWLAEEVNGTVVIFASPSAWQNFHHYYQLNPFPLFFASIGPVTTKAIEATDFTVTYEAPECTMVSLVAEILKAEVKR